MFIYYRLIPRLKLQFQITINLNSNFSFLGLNFTVKKQILSDQHLAIEDLLNSFSYTIKYDPTTVSYLHTSQIVFILHRLVESFQV